MTEFRAPPPPPELSEQMDVSPASTRVTLENLLDWKNVDPKVWGILGIILVAGMLLGVLFFSGSEQVPQQQVQGLTNIIYNPAVAKERLMMCGLVSETAPCVIYIMNNSRGDRVAEDFFEEAAKLTNRNRYRVEIENTEYAKMRIRPSFFAQIKIPALR